MKKIVVVGCQGVGKTTICKRVYKKEYKQTFFNTNDGSIFNYKIKNPSILTGHKNEYINMDCYTNDLVFIPEQFREVVKDIPNFTKQTEEITLATYAKQLYLENLYTLQGKNILCDRSVLDCFVYYNYFNKDIITLQPEDYIPVFPYANIVATNYTQSTYSKIYLIEPSDREIESDGFRLTDKKQQLEIHKLFLEYFKDFENVIIVNQEKQDEIVEMIVNDFIC
jgi:GTPase SAR1 family protein